jgi:hypothetical protein
VESGIFRVQIPGDGLSLRVFLNELFDFGIQFANVCFRVFLVFPQADSHKFLSFMGDENQLVHESVPVLQQGQDFFFEPDREFLGEIFFLAAG